MKRSAFLIGAALLLISLLIFGTYVFLSSSEINGAARAFTIKMPDADRIEIEAVHLHGENIDGVLATKVLQGSETAPLLHLWRSQNYRFNGSVMCHFPAYRLRFYMHQSLLTEATICFHCHNIYFDWKNSLTGKDEGAEADFNLNEKDGTPNLLQNYLEGLFSKTTS